MNNLIERIEAELGCELTESLLDMYKKECMDDE